MRAVLQRVACASLTIDGQEKAQIGRGLVVLLGVCPGDTPEIAAKLAAKVAGLRVFEDAQGKMNLSLLDINGQALVVSNFTLYADCRQGRRPSYTGAAAPALAQPLYEEFAHQLRKNGVQQLQTGEFGADMQISLCNDGPVTLVLDSSELFPDKTIC